LWTSPGEPIWRRPQYERIVIHFHFDVKLRCTQNIDLYGICGVDRAELLKIDNALHLPHLKYRADIGASIALNEEQSAWIVTQG